MMKREERPKSSQDLEEFTSLEGIDMEKTRIETTNQPEKLVCPKAGILVQTRRRPHIG